MPKGYHHLTRDQRCQIYALRATKTSQSQIAQILGVHRSSISREIKRNTGGNGYRQQQADHKAQARRSEASSITKKLTPTLKEQIRAGIQKDWSPEQISGRLKRENISISHETIYRYIQKDRQAKETLCLYKHLRRAGKRYRKRGSGGKNSIPNRIDISERPSIVESKSRIGDWEGDTIVGKEHQGAIISYVDRHSKFTLLKKIERRAAQLVHQYTVDRMKQLPHPVFSITYDNGTEFAWHEKVAKELNTVCYFARPYHAWERGLNEHTNGLVRQYIPKSSSLAWVTDQQIQAIEDRLNHRPRKVLQYLTPFEVFFATSPS